MVVAQGRFGTDPDETGDGDLAGLGLMRHSVRKEFVSNADDVNGFDNGCGGGEHAGYDVGGHHSAALIAGTCVERPIADIVMVMVVLMIMILVLIALLIMMGC